MRIGALFYGTGALDMAVQRVWGGELGWLAENDRNVARIATWNNTDVRNLGDVTRVDWAKVEPVDIITGGSPCQDLSHAGRRGGMRQGMRSNLWVQMREAIATIRPRLVVWENVRGAITAGADSALEFCPRCVGDRRGVHLRALGRVLGDLADLGYDARWHGLSASEVGAPHGRYRVFLLAYPRDSAPPDPIDAGPHDRSGGEDGRPDPHLRVRPGQLLPTPTVIDLGDNKDIAQWDEFTAQLRAAHDNGNGHGRSLEIEMQRMSKRGHWGKYQPAVLRWERLTRTAPRATKFNPDLGLEQLTPEFAEWMMGLPEGMVTSVPGLDRKPALRALGNGVVPQQAEAAFRLMTNWTPYDQSRRPL